MTSNTLWGPFALEERLGSDALGSLMKARRAGEAAVAEPLLLRIFDSPALDQRRLWESLDDRRVVQLAVRGPNLAQGLDLGEIDGVPYLAYAWREGWPLAQELAAVRAGRKALALERALGLAKRVARGLMIGTMSRVDGRPVNHGFVVPELIWVSTRGEVELQGLEAGPGLAAAGLKSDSRLAKFLSPEVRQGLEPTVADDLYSLGALLFELVTGQEAALDGIADRAHEARTPDGERLPPDLARLLAESLAPRAARVKDIETWSAQLAVVISALRGTALEHLLPESGQASVRSVTVSKPPVAPPPAGPTTNTPPRTVTTIQGGGRGAWVAGVAALLLLLGGAAWLLLREPGTLASEPRPAAAQTSRSSASTAAPSSPLAAASSGPPAEEITSSAEPARTAQAPEEPPRRPPGPEPVAAAAAVGSPQTSPRESVTEQPPSTNPQRSRELAADESTRSEPTPPEPRASDVVAPPDQPRPSAAPQPTVTAPASSQPTSPSPRPTPVRDRPEPVLERAPVLADPAFVRSRLRRNSIAVRARVSTEGRVVEVSLSEPQVMPAEVSKAVVLAVRGAHFAPAVVGGEAVERWVLVRLDLTEP